MVDEPHKRVSVAVFWPVDIAGRKGWIFDAKWSFPNVLKLGENVRNLGRI